MRKRTSPTILERAIITVPEFEKVLTTLSQQVTLRGQRKSTLDNYGRRIALPSLKRDTHLPVIPIRKQNTPYVHPKKVYDEL